MADTIDLSTGIGQRIKQAADELRLLQIVYVDAKHNPTIRTVEPYEIKNGKLFAYCITKNSIRAFTLGNIQSAELHLSEFAPRFPVLI